MASADAPGVRRTQSTGDINDTVTRPEPARLPHGHRRSTTVSPHDSQLIVDGFSRPNYSLPAPALTSASIPASARSHTPSAPQAAQDPDNELHIRLDGLSPDDIATMRRAVDTLAQMRETTDMETLTRALETIQEIRERGDRHRRERAQPWPRRLLRFLGYGRRNKERKELVSVVFNTSFAIVQFVVITALLAYSHHLRSATDPTKNEWDACSRPLGVWDALWIGRTVLSCSVGYWGWQRARQARARRNTEPRNNAASSAERGQPRTSSATSTSGASPLSRNASSSELSNSNTTPSPSHSLLYARLSLLSSLFTGAWFLVAHVYLYSSLDTCRLSSPHLWWLTFGILCILYLLVLEVIAFGVVYLIVFPILVLVWNIVLLCVGRHPYFNPSGMKPEIGKLPKSTVDRIPLVLYIPPPDDDFLGKGVEPKAPLPAHTYPPSKSADRNTRPKRRFRFLRLRPKKNPGSDGETRDNLEKDAAGGLNAWEDRWEDAEYPFVRLEGNRAVCAICLMDFEEPKRKPISSNGNIEDTTSLTSGATAVPSADVSNRNLDGEETTNASAVQEVLVTEPTAEEEATLRLEDAGDGAQPLRLLECGHVFHQTCLDPWLIDVSGRCPVCQRPVELPPTKKPRRRVRTEDNARP